MTGEELKLTLQESGYSQSELARRLGMSQQSFNKALTVADVKSGFLEKIAHAIGRDMSFFYSACAGAGVNTHGNNNTVQVGDNNCCVPTTKDDDEDVDLDLGNVCDIREEIKYLREQNKKLVEWLDRLIRQQK